MAEVAENRDYGETAWLATENDSDTRYEVGNSAMTKDISKELARRIRDGGEWAEAHRGEPDPDELDAFVVGDIVQVR